MTAIQLIKSPGGLLRPANQVDADLLSKITNGRLLNAEITQPRNPAFLRKFFVMLGFFFELWEIPEELEYNGIKPEKNFDQFRKDILIAAGFRELVVNIKGECRYVAKSISFGAMDDTEFSEVYKLVFSVCWKYVMGRIGNYTPEQAENTINQMMSYD
jgi:hypothetical protein